MTITRNLIVFAFLALLVSTFAFNSRAQIEQPPAAPALQPAPATENLKADDKPVDLLKLEDADKRAGLGVTFGIDHYGVFCKFVYPGSPAAKAGLHPGIRILSVNEIECRTIQETVTAIRALKPGDEVTMRIVHDGDFKTCTATLSTWEVAFGAVLQQDDNLANRVTQLEGKHTSLAEIVDSKFNATTDRVTKAEVNVAALQKQAESAEKGIETLQKGAESSQKTIESLQKDAELTQKTIESSQKAIDASQKSIETLQKNAALAQKDIESSQKTIEASQKSIETLQKNAASAQKDIESAQKNVEALQKTVDSLAVLAAVVKKSDEKIATLEKNLEALGKEREAMTIQIGALQAEISKLKTAAQPAEPKKEPADSANESKDDSADKSDAKKE